MAQLTCEGMFIDAFDVPSFDVRTGEFVALDFPERSRLDITPVFDALGTPAARGPVHAIGSVHKLEFIFPHSGFRQIFRRERVLEWFRQETQLPRDEALRYLQRIGIRPDAQLSTLAGNPRWLIAFEAALARGAEIVVFRTAGLDPPGVRAALQRVSNELEQIGALHVDPPRDFDLEVRYSRRLDVTLREIEPVLR